MWGRLPACPTSHHDSRFGITLYTGFDGEIVSSDMLAGVTAAGAVTVVVPPGSASSASVGAVGASGASAEPAAPDSAAPPLLISTIVPLMATPLESIVIKFPPTLSLIPVPASIPTVVPAFK